MNYPTVKTIQTQLSVSREIAAQIRKALTMDAAEVNSHPVWLAELAQRGVDRDNASYGWIPLQERRLFIVNGLLSGYGVERADGIADYVNMGSTYAETVLWDLKRGRYAICSWGDLVERAS